MDAAISALSSAHNDDMGRVEIVVADGTSKISLPNVSGVVPAASVVSAPDGILSLLAATVIAEDLDAARAA